MFDAATTELIKSAPILEGIDIDELPKFLTGIFTELTTAKLRLSNDATSFDINEELKKLKRIATVYEAAVDIGIEGDSRKAAAFVAATAHQLLGTILINLHGNEQHLLTTDSIHPFVAAPLLFLIAGQYPDAKEAARMLSNQPQVPNYHVQIELIDAIRNLCEERFTLIQERAHSQRIMRPMDVRISATDAATQALYGLCWDGIVHLTANLLGSVPPNTSFSRGGSPQETFQKVIQLSVYDVSDISQIPQIVSNYSGPRHLARLLWFVDEAIRNSGLINLPTPNGADEQQWQSWLNDRAKKSPLLWDNHKAAIQTGFLDQGKSAVLVLPTGAGKTTISELKIASILSAGKKVIFIVPTLALVDQQRDELARNFSSQIGEAEISGDGDLQALLEVAVINKIEVMTPERCLALLSHAPESVLDVGLVVFDECHLLSSEGGGYRSLDAMLCLLNLLKRAPEADFLLLSAMISNADEVSEWLSKITTRDCISFHDPWKPSRQARGVVVYPAAEITTLRAQLQAYSQARNRAHTRTRIPKPSCNATPYALFGLRQNWNPDISSDFSLLQLLPRTVQLGFPSHGIRPTPNANDVADSIAVQAATTGIKTILFVQQKDHAVSNAKKISEQLPEIASITTREAALWEVLKSELGGEEFSLINPTAAAIPHNSDMLPLERRIAESIFRNSDGAQVIVATPTLAQGMNLPAQLALLAGDIRHEDLRRMPLQAHEILNAAGRAGRAGHLANGIVLLVPEPIATFSQNGAPDLISFRKLQTLLPDSDQCIELTCPLENLLDLIQNGQDADKQVYYFLNRLQAVHGEEQPLDNAMELINKSLPAFKAQKEEEKSNFEDKINSLKEALQKIQSEHPEVEMVSASYGLPKVPLTGMWNKIQEQINSLPFTIPGWIDWIIDYFKVNSDDFELIMERDLDDLKFAVRGSKTAAVVTENEFECLKSGMKCWLQGHTLKDIEIALGVPEENLGKLKRARCLTLRLANRRFYLIASAISELASKAYESREIDPNYPAVLKVFPIGIRKGLDTPDKIAYSHLRPQFKSRITIHDKYHQDIQLPILRPEDSYTTLLSNMAISLLFQNLE